MGKDTVVCRNGSSCSTPDNSHHNNNNGNGNGNHGTMKSSSKANRRARSTTTSFILAATVLLVTAWTTLREPNRVPAGRFMTQQEMTAARGGGPSIPPDATAACLLMFDDNLSLVEWLAYHYHTMNLRHVIVLTDPRSTESPVPILQRWVGRVSYEYWDESRVFPNPAAWQTLRDAGDLVQLHRHRQSYFYAQCMRELKLRSEQSSSDNHHHDEWLLLTDVDEYVAMNPHTMEKSHKLYRPQLGNLTLDAPGAILDFLRRERNTPACLHMASRDMVSKESSPADINVGVPAFLNATAFYTTRWRHQSHRRITGKCLVNLKQIEYHDIPVQSPRQGHVPLPRCPSHAPKYFYDMDNTPLVVHHYLGTPAQYQYRDDPRRDRTQGGFEKKQQYPTEVRDTVRSWLPGFVRQVGPDQAAALLQGAGTLGGGAKEE